HNSQARFPQPKWSKGTTEQISSALQKWAGSNLWQDEPGICWLRGSAGSGKSAIAQTIAEVCEGKELPSSFFFSKSDPNRNNPQYLVFAIAHGITTTIPSLQSTTRQVVQNKPEILEASLESQFKALVTEPLLSRGNWLWNLVSYSRIVKAPPTLVIIDGLDECHSTSDQQQVLSLVVSAMQHKLPIRFLICSHPESHIRDQFNQQNLRQFTTSILLDGDLTVNQDIETMLRDEFRKIRNSERCKHMIFPTPWPMQGDIETLVEKAGGQFSYASVVVKF
ncbi:hypothetical protein L218DRAFT_831810, partial [Marasmius fiardii PR-910]